MSDILDKYRDLKREHPTAYTIAAVTPVIGSAVAIPDYIEAMDRGDSADAAMAAASLIPGIKLAKFGSKLAPAAHELAASRAFAPTSARAILAPATANSDLIGKGAAAEQVSEYAMKKAEAAAEDRAYSVAWNDVMKTP